MERGYLADPLIPMIGRQLAGAPLPIANPASQTATLGTAHAAPDTLCLIGGEGVLETLIAHGTHGANGLGGRDYLVVFTYWEEKVVV